ncbi:waprin-Thr1-like [Bacillus rossius redtenbacheri]|uniref:waprin-Thr1-like n=1 Tax=Bacillus rossius redtenbacheri TaxID=93214 RepID=UPI002FDCBB4E
MLRLLILSLAALAGLALTGGNHHHHHHNHHQEGMCPAPEGAGVCAATCQSDSNCTAGQRCCRNACNGTSCANVTALPPARG